MRHISYGRRGTGESVEAMTLARGYLDLGVLDGLCLLMSRRSVRCHPNISNSCNKVCEFVRNACELLVLLAA